MCEPCKDIAHKSIDERLLYMFLYGQGDDACPLARERLAWLALQEMRGKPYARPMPDDPVPDFWPSTERRQVSKGTTGIIAKIKAAYSIEEIARQHTNLHGNSVLKGKCFLHGEQKGEAFTIWTDDEKWRCFGQCNTGGDVIDLVRAMRERGLSWMKS